jgi:sugar transferase (PEP-CTERM system associated)
MLRLFKHYIPKSLFALGAAETAWFFVSVYVGTWLRFRGGEAVFPESVLPVWPKALLYATVMAVMMMAMGLYRRDARDGPGGMPLRVLLGFALGLVVLTLLFYVFPDLILGRGMFGYTHSVALAGVAIGRLVFLRLADQALFKRRVLVLGTGELARLVAEADSGSSGSGFEVVGYVHQPGDHDVVDYRSILSVPTNLVDLVVSHRVDALVIAVPDRRGGLAVHEILDCKTKGVEVMDLSTFFEQENGQIQLDALHPAWLIASDGFRQGALTNAVKRLFDVVAALLLLLATWPVMAVAALCIWAEDRGPVLYKQVRVGRSWNLFQVYKFRSMRTDAERDGPRWADKNDARITGVGAFIRKVRIDELPQIFNVLRGQMSFIGPRPERPMFVEQLAERIPYYEERHRVKPGITGWAQINYQYGASERDAVEKLQYDLYYVKNYGLFLDLLIMTQTVQVILWGKGAQ